MPQKVYIPASANGKKLSDWLIEQGYSLSAACGGRGTCGKCRVKIVKGAFCDSSAPDTFLSPDKNGYLLACRALCDTHSIGAEILLPDTDGAGLTQFLHSREFNGQQGWGVALDIGTTTLAAALVNTGTGRVLSSVSRLNPQRSYGADVISRISACADGHLEELTRLIRQAAAEMIAEFSAQHPDIQPQRMTVSGNTTMLHLFCGVSPVGMGAYPFTPAFTQKKVFTGKQLSLPLDTVILLPSASAFIGSDVIAGAAALDMLQTDEPSVLIDIGTNGEMLLCTGASHKLYTASTAAGPALEGAKISCGVGGIDGAVCRVAFSKKDKSILYRTIHDKPRCGICGCGLVDAISVMLYAGVIDETGYMEEGAYTLTGTHIAADGEKIPTEGETVPLTLTQQDIREFQLAKSAIAAGLEALTAHAGLKMEQIRHVFIAGGLGYYMDTANAKKVGLLPEELSCDIQAVGNTSLAGAIACLCDSSWLEKASQIALACENFELNQSAVFNQAFIERMLFSEE